MANTTGTTTAYFSSGAGAPSGTPSVAGGEWAFYENTSNGDLYVWNLSGTPRWTKVTIPPLVGDSGSGGTAGYAPAPGSGDAAAGKFLKADATWAVPAGGGGGNYTLITDTLLSGTAASFDLTSIPGTYKHVKLIGQLRDDANVGGDPTQGFLRLNGDAGANYDYTLSTRYAATITTITSAGQSSVSLQYIAGTGATAGIATSFEIVIPNYAATTLRKQLRYTGQVKYTDGGTHYNIETVAEWKSTGAITEVTLYPGSSANFVAGSRVSLYGLN